MTADPLYAIRPTAAGRALIAQALAGGAPIELSHFAIGDGGGEMPPPDAEGLIREVYRAPLADVRRDAVNTAHVVAEAVIPGDVGPFWVREMALMAVDGTMVAIAACPPAYKAATTDGIAQDIAVTAIMEIAEAATVVINVDASAVYMTRAAVEALMEQHRQSRDDHPRATTALVGMTQLAAHEAVIAGEDDTTAVTPAGLAHLTATDDRRGLVRLATLAESEAGASSAVGETPAGTSAAIAAALAPINTALRPRRARRAYLGG